MRKTFAILICMLMLGAGSTAWAATVDIDKELDLAYEAEDAGQYSKAIEILLPLVQQVPKDSTTLLSDILNSLSVDHLRLGQYDQAMEYGEQCLAIDEKEGNEENLSSSLNNLAAICVASERFQLAEEYLQKGIEIEERLGRDDKLAIRLGMLSECYTLQHRTQEAIPLARRALELDRKAGREDKMAIRLSQLGNALAQAKQWQEAEPYLDEAYTLLIKYQNYTSLSMTAVSLGETKRGLNKRAEAEKLLKQAIHIAAQTGQRDVRRNAYLELSRFYSDTEAYADACHYLNAYIQLNDSLNGETVQRQISDLQVRYETEQKELELARQQITIQRQQYITVGLCILLAVLAIAFAVVYKSLRMKKRMIQLRDHLMRIISHDLKNPALATQRSLHIMNKHFGQLTPAEVHDSIKAMAENSDAQVHLLFDLLTWAQLQAHRLVLTPLQLDLNSVVQEVVSQHACQAELKNIAISMHTPQAALAVADRQCANTIVRNLLCNAIKFSDPGSTVEIATQGSTLRITDHGRGMAPGQQPATGTAGEQGTGMGMDLVRTLVQMNNASMQIESQQGQGTTVSVTFGTAK